MMEKWLELFVVVVWRRRDKMGLIYGKGWKMKYEMSDWLFVYLTVWAIIFGAW